MTKNCKKRYIIPQDNLPSLDAQKSSRGARQLEFLKPATTKPGKNKPAARPTPHSRNHRCVYTNKPFTDTKPGKKTNYLGDNANTSFTPTYMKKNTITSSTSSTKTTHLSRTRASLRSREVRACVSKTHTTMRRREAKLLTIVASSPVVQV